jgi:hypothetical protein
LHEGSRRGLLDEATRELSAGGAGGLPEEQLVVRRVQLRDSERLQEEHWQALRH